VQVRPNTLVALGYGKYVRADKIVALEPIEDERGPGRRTRVFIEGVPAPLIASRTESTILHDMVEESATQGETRSAAELLTDILEDLRGVGPMLRRSIHEEGHLDLDRIERRAREILGYEDEE